MGERTDVQIDRQIFNKNFPPLRLDRSVVVFISMGDEIRQYRTSSKEYSDAILTAQRAHALDVDAGRRLLYWTDTSVRRIYRAAIPRDAKLAGSPQDLQIAGLQQPQGLSVDWVARYVCEGFQNIMWIGWLSMCVRDFRYNVDWVAKYVCEGFQI